MKDPPELQLFWSADFFATDHRPVVTFKLHAKSIEHPKCDPAVFQLEKLKDLTYAQEYAMTVSNRFGALDTLEDREELWDTFKRDTLEATKDQGMHYAALEVTEWFRLDGDTGKY